MDLAGSVAVVTGGGSGIGAGAAAALAEMGVHVVVFDRDEAAAERVAYDIGGFPIAGDVTSTDDLTAAAARAASLGSVRVLVNAAGIVTTGRIVGRSLEVDDAFSLDLFDRVLDVNLAGTFNASRVLASFIGREPAMSDGERGVIVNVASLAGLEGQIGQSAYAASKGGVIALTLPLARDLAVLGIRVNTVAPGAIDTPMIGNGPHRDVLAAQALFPPRLGDPREVADVIVLCASNSYVNATTIRVDGGARLGPK